MEIFKVLVFAFSLYMSVSLLHSIIEHSMNKKSTDKIHGWIVILMVLGWTTLYAIS